MVRVGVQAGLDHLADCSAAIRGPRIPLYRSRGPDMARIQLVLSNMPDLLRDIVADAVSGETDMEIAAEAQSVAELESCLNGERPDLIVAAEHDADFASASRRLLRARVPPTCTGPGPRHRRWATWAPRR
jgi:hypothetical protein